ncbi:hypothetical protein [Mesorhizobium abyssinicae]|uniref:nSTAND3 domain-containing NTPase n=1 Tax=Mesorhizobium abyssinicae TaxID=1209958 RepID=UPI003398999F
MTIAITAPQKFAFQDLVCVEMMLRFWSESSAAFFVEPDGGEDGELVFAAGHTISRCEIQVKGAEAAVSLAALATCLAHTPPRRADSTLLERLIADPERLALLVVSGRADDASSVYLGSPSWLGDRHSKAQISDARTNALIQAFAVAEVPGAEDGKLKGEREAHNAAFARDADVSEVRDALRRVIVLDQIDDAALQTRVAERLRQNHYLPADRADAVIRELTEAVAKAKTNRSDAFPLLRAVVAKAAPPAIRPPAYVLRGDETSLFDEFSRENVILLSGTPRTGKSFAARWLASEFMPLGYDVQEFADVDGAERFLLDPGDALRVALLDDPLGESGASSDSTRSLSRLSKLIGRIRPQRKLLVSQGMAPLLATARTASLGQTHTGGRYWKDLSNPEAEFLVDMWKSLGDAFGVDASLRERVTNAISAGNLKLEPGCLEHLAAEAYRVHPSSTIEDIARLARVDAAQLGQTLAADGYEDLARSLAVATATQEPIDPTSLAFVRGSGGSALPSRRVAKFSVVSIGGPAVPPAPPPAYETPPQLLAADRIGLDALERQRLVTVDARNCAGFAHPFYRAAAESLLNAPTQFAAQAIATAVERGLFCLSSSTSRATARNLDWIFDKLETRPVEREQLVASAISGLKSFYPATRDLCFRFLVNHLPALPPGYERKLPVWIGHVTSVTLAKLEWMDGEAHVPFGDATGSSYFERMFQTVERDQVAEELAALDAPDSAVSPERAAATLKYLADAPDSMTLSMVGRLLSYDEAALRAEAAKVWLSLSRHNDEGALERIFADDHPSCALAALQGVINGWERNDTTRRTRQLDGLELLARSGAAAAVMLGDLVVFNRVEHTGRNPPWPIFERLMPVVMATLPHNAMFVDARLFAVAKSALDALPASSIIALCDGWIEWLERNERAGDLPGEYALAVGEILISATATSPENRDSRLARLVAFSGTGANAVFVADLVDHWDQLRDDERSMMLLRLRAGRADDVWLQAVALTRSSVPDEIAIELLPDGSWYSGPEQLVDSSHQSLIEAAVHVYCGRPQPLWWLGTHHNGKQQWEPVVEILARRPYHPLFELAWDHIVFKGDGKRVARLVAEVGATGAEPMFEILLRQKVGTTGDFMPEAWAALLGLATSEEQRGRWLDRMAELAPVIIERLSDLAHWLSEPQDRLGIVDRLPEDFIPLRLIGRVFDPPMDREVQKEAVKALQAIVQDAPPKLYATCDRLIEMLKNAAVDTTSIVAALTARRTEIFDELRAIRESVEKPDPPLAGWIKP